MVQGRNCARKWGVAALICFGLAGCRATTPSETTQSIPTSAKVLSEDTLDRMAVADYQAALNDFTAARQELESLKREAQQTRIRVENVRQQLRELENARASEVEAIKQKRAVLEASYSK